MGTRAKDRDELLPGTLDMLILKTLSIGVMHGYGIAQHIRQVSDEVLQVEEGSLYPALYRMEHRGWIKASWALTEQGRRAKYYRLTAAGRRQLAAALEGWKRTSAAMAKIVAARRQPA